MPVRLRLAAALIEDVLNDFPHLELAELKQIQEVILSHAAVIEQNIPDHQCGNSTYQRQLFEKLKYIALSLEAESVYDNSRLHRNY